MLFVTRNVDQQLIGCCNNIGFNIDIINTIAIFQFETVEKKSNRHAPTLNQNREQQIRNNINNSN